MNPLGETDFRVGAWLIAPKLNSLSSDGKTVRLEPKVMQVLICLAEAGDVVPKEKLMNRVWAGTFVTDDVLTRSISELRKAFEDDPKNPRFIQTIPKGGYRLLVPAEPLASGNGAKVTPRLSPELHSLTATPPATRHRRAIPLAIALATLAAVLLTTFALRRLSSAARMAPGRAQRAVLAVLPFQNINNDPSQDYFVDGLTAEMISQLGRLPSDRLGVIAWGSMIRYKGAKRSETEIGGELGANYILEGTVRRESQKVRITAELLKVGDRSQIWSNSYDGDLGDVLAVQSRIAREIAQEIQLQLTPEQQARLDNPVQVNAEAYDEYLKGRIDTNGFSPMTMNMGAESLKQAIRLTPNYPPPYISLAAFYRGQASYGFAASKPAYANAKAAVDKALQLDPSSAAAHREKAWIDWRGDWNFVHADKEFRISLEINPGEAVSHETYSLYLKSAGRYNEALDEINRCLELSPMASVSHANAGTVLGMLRRYDEAMAQFRRGVEVNPRDPYVRERMGAVLLWQGKTDEAIQAFQTSAELSNRHPEKLVWLGYGLAVDGKTTEARAILDEIMRNPRLQYVSPFYVAMLYAGLEDKEQAFSWLEKAYTDHDEWMVYLKIYPEFANLRSDPRFQDLIRRVGIP